MNLRALFIIFTIALRCFHAHGQILHSESFEVILDTTRFIKGNIVPDFKFQNLKEDLIEFENTSDISFRIKKSAITVANKIEFSKYGNEAFASGGFLYFEYRKFFESKFVLEPFSQLHWAESRGLKFKYAGGIRLRYRIFLSEQVGFYFGTGPFYEYEKWNYDGVKDSLIPANSEDIIRENIKSGSYLSFKWKSNFKIDVDISLYHQSTYDEIFNSPRLASSTSVKYNITENLGLILQYQNIYDSNPVVPIDKLYNKVLATIEVSF